MSLQADLFHTIVERTATVRSSGWKAVSTMRTRSTEGVTLLDVSGPGFAFLDGLAVGDAGVGRGGVTTGRTHVVRGACRGNHQDGCRREDGKPTRVRFMW